MTKQIQKEDIRIYCNHCKTIIESVWICRIDSIIGLRYIYICTNCKSNLGTYHSKNLLDENPSLRVAAQ